MADARVRWLLGLAVVLGVLRFVVVPWTQQQVEQRQQLEVLTQRLDRSAGVVQSKDAILSARDALARSTAATRKDFPVVEDPQRFRLEAQRQLAAIAAGGNVKVTLFDWIMDGAAGEAGLAYGRVNVKLDGPLDRLAAVHGEIEGRMPFAAIREAKVELGRGAASLGSGPGSITLVVDLYYRAPPRSAAPAAVALQEPA